MNQDVAAIARGERRAIAKAITLVESRARDDRRAAADLLAQVMPRAGRALRLGVSGAPGVGKSSFIEAYGLRLLDHGHRLGVLAVDPTSPISGGAILGDKTRMERLTRDGRAFVRPSPSGGAHGGVARYTRDAIAILEAAGHDRIIVETVGVGQNETRVAEMTDLFVLLLPPAGGDELQGIKRGVMELADIVLVTKADGALAPVAERTVADYRAALRLMRPRDGAGGWRPPVIAISNVTGAGFDALDEAMADFERALGPQGIARRRAAQAAEAFLRALGDDWLDHLRHDPHWSPRLAEAEAAVAAGQASPILAAESLIAAILARPD